MSFAQPHVALAVMQMGVAGSDAHALSFVDEQTPHVPDVSQAASAGVGHARGPGFVAE